VPERVLDNHELEKLVDTSDEWIVQRTGIRERRIVAEGQSTSDLCIEAGRRALEDAGLAATDLDLIVIGTVTPDMHVPATACLVQQRLGATRAAAFDLQAGCTGFVYALNVAANYLWSGSARNVLVIGAGCLSRITNFRTAAPASCSGTRPARPCSPRTSASASCAALDLRGRQRLRDHVSDRRRRGVPIQPRAHRAGRAPARDPRPRGLQVRDQQDGSELVRQDRPTTRTSPAGRGHPAPDEPAHHRGGARALRAARRTASANICATATSRPRSPLALDEARHGF
jgi:hypothetical protein